MDRDQLIQQIAQAERIINDEVGTIPHFFTVVVTANSGNLKGPVARMTPDAPLGIHNTWNWEWRL